VLTTLKAQVTDVSVEIFYFVNIDGMTLRSIQDTLSIVHFKHQQLSHSNETALPITGPAFSTLLDSMCLFSDDN